MTILVTGGTGTLGKLVVPRLRDAGAEVRVISRHPGQDTESVRYLAADLDTGEGVAAAFDGARTVVHLAGARKGDDVKTRTVTEAARKAGAEHLVLISVVGADRVPQVSRVDRALFGYFGMKLATERIVEQSGLPWTTLRAAQFHDLMLMTARGLAKLPVVPVFSGVRFQPIETAEVADRLAELALGEPAGLVPDAAGPEILGMRDIVTSYLAAVGKRRVLLPVHAPGRASQAVRDGANLAPEHAVGKRTWAQFLADRAGRPGGQRLGSAG